NLAPKLFSTVKKKRSLLSRQKKTFRNIKCRNVLIIEESFLSDFSGNGKYNGFFAFGSSDLNRLSELTCSSCIVVRLDFGPFARLNGGAGVFSNRTTTTWFYRFNEYHLIGIVLEFE